MVRMLMLLTGISLAAGSARAEWRCAGERHVFYLSDDEPNRPGLAVKSAGPGQSDGDLLLIEWNQDLDVSNGGRTVQTRDRRAFVSRDAVPFRSPVFQAGGNAQFEGKNERVVCRMLRPQEWDR